MLSSRQKRFGAVTVAALVATLTLAGCSAGSSSTGSSSDDASSSGTWAKAKGTIVFAASPDQAGSDSNNKPLEDYIAKKTGYKVEYYPTADYTALTAAAVAGKVDMMTSGPLGYVMAVNKGAKLKPVVAIVGTPGLKDPGYYSEAIVPKGSAIKKVADAKGKTVCFVDPNSTSGFLYGLDQLKKAGLDVKSTSTDANGNPVFSDFTAYFAGSHDKSVEAVASKQCDMGFAEDSVATPAAAKGDITVIGKAYVPGGPVDISTTLPASVQAKLTKVLKEATLENIKKSGVTLTDGFTSSYFGVNAEPLSYYESVYDVCNSIPAAQCSK